MARYYFHIVCDGVVARDEEGMELPSPLDALAEAEQSAFDLREEAAVRVIDPDSVIQIVEASGRLFEAVPIFPDRASPKVTH